jgi:hypothetical protein
MGGEKVSDYIERYWRDATPQDAIKEPPMVARFRDDDGGEWKWNGRLLGIDRSVISGCVWCAKNAAFRYCQVYDAPDPGEGWRLIDPEKDKPQEGDEIYERETRTWRRRLTKFQSWALSINRRRIEPPKPKYEPFRWEDREQLRGRWITWQHEDGTTIETQISHLSEHRLEGFWFKSRNPKWLLENATFLDTGEPVGRKVE